MASAAYRSASRMRDERIDRVQDFSNKRGVVYSEIMLAEGAPEDVAAVFKQLRFGGSRARRSARPPDGAGGCGRGHARSRQGNQPPQPRAGRTSGETTRRALADTEKAIAEIVRVIASKVAIIAPCRRG